MQMEYVTWTVYNKLLFMKGKFYVFGEKLIFEIVARSNLRDFYLLSQNYSICNRKAPLCELFHKRKTDINAAALIIFIFIS